jgi:hypothetical protein
MKVLRGKGGGGELEITRDAEARTPRHRGFCSPFAVRAIAEHASE